MQNKRTYKTGYTLIEILIALFIFSIIMLIVGQAIHSATKNHDILSKQAQRLLDVQTALSIMALDFDQIVKNENHKPILTQIHLAFDRLGHLDPNNAFARTPSQKIGYQFSDGMLVRYLYAEHSQTPQARTLLTHIDALSWQFLGADQKWYPTWPPTSQGAKSLPLAIQCDIHLADFGSISRLLMVSRGNHA